MAEDEEDHPGQWVQLLDNHIVKKILTPGDGPGPEPKDTAVCSYIGRVKDSQKVFIKENGARFTIGEGDTTMGLELTLRHMKANEKSLVVVDSKYAYGPFGRKSIDPDEAAVPPDAAVEYEVQLHGSLFMPNASTEEKLLYGQYQKGKGNDHFRRQEYREALKAYSAILKLFSADDENPEVTSLLVDCHNNSAAVLGKEEKWNKAKEACVEALTLDPDNLRGLNRAADVAMALADWDEAEMAWKRALEVDPDCKQAQQGLAKLEQKRVAHKQKERQMFMGKFSKLSESLPDVPTPGPTKAASHPAVLSKTASPSPPAGPGTPEAAAAAGDAVSRDISPPAAPSDTPCDGEEEGNVDEDKEEATEEEEEGVDKATATNQTAASADGAITQRSIIQFCVGLLLAFLLAMWDPLQ